jgi:acetoin utilization protein AcuB
MLLVKDSMEREIVTLAPDETAATALAVCRERRIRHLPVLKGGRIVGLVSDRDLRSSTPALGDPDRAAALQRVVVEDVMAREVITADPDDPIEQAANTMRWFTWSAPTSRAAAWRSPSPTGRVHWPAPQASSGCAASTS